LFSLLLTTISAQILPATLSRSSSGEATDDALKCARIFRHAFIEIVMSIQLAPDIEAGLRAEAVALGMSVDTLIASAVKAYLRDGIPAPPGVFARALG
jgi:hypothetical protein